jgi:hypothetical protein
VWCVWGEECEAIVLLIMSSLSTHSPEDLAHCAQLLAMGSESLVRLRDFPTLLRDTAQLSTPAAATTTEAFLASLSPDNAHHTAEQISAEHTRQFHVAPYEIDRFRQLLASTPLASYFDESGLRSHTEEDIHAMLRSGGRRVPMQRAGLEQELLMQSGLWEHRGKQYNFPACSRGEQCFAFTDYQKIPGLKVPIQLTGMMFQNEFDEFLASNTLPACSRPCVLCCRDIVSDWIYTIRGSRMMGKPGTQQCSDQRAFEQVQNRVMQFYFNLMDTEGGYFSSYMVTPTQSEPLLQPIVRLNLSLLAARKLKGGRICIDQSALVYKPPSKLPARPGELVSSF